MDKKERKEQHLWLLPPDYVSLAQLRERWLEKQLEKELREKQKEEQKEERKERDAGLNENQNQRGYLLKNDWRVKKAGGGHRRDSGVAIKEKGKGKEINIGSSENKKKKKKKKHRRNKKYNNGCESETEDLNTGTYNKEFSGSEEPKIVSGNEEKVGNKGILSGESSGDGRFHDGLKASTEEIPNRKDFRGGFSRNGNNRGSGYEIPNRKDFRGGFARNGNNRGSGYDGKRENRVMMAKETKVELALEKMMEDREGHNSRTWRERKRDVYYRSKEDGADVLKDNVVETKLGKKVEDDNLEVHSEICGLNGKDRNKSSNDSRLKREGLSNDSMLALDKKVDEEVLAVETVRSAEKGIRNGYWSYGNWRGNNGRRIGGGGLAINGRKVNVGDRMRYSRPGRFEDGWKTKQRDMNGMMWVKKEDKLGADEDDARVGSCGISED